MPRLTKQLIYGSAFILILIIAAGLVYLWVMPKQDCGNGRKDWGEEGVDCGGKCAKVCIPPDIAPVAPAGDLAIFHPTSEMVSVAVLVGNSNADFAGKNFEYRIDFYGDGDRFLGSVVGRSYIYGGELKYLTGYFRSKEAPNVKTAELEIANVQWVPVSEFAKPQVSIREKTAGEREGLIEVTGKAVNNHTVDVPEISLVTVFKGNSGIPVGVSETKLLNVKAGEVRDFRVIHPPISGAVLSRTEYAISGRAGTE